MDNDAPIDDTPADEPATGDSAEEAAAALASRPPAVRLVLTDDLRRSRVTVLFRLLLALLHLVVVGFWGLAVALTSIVTWFALLIEGRAPKSLQEFATNYVRYAAQVSAYLNLAAEPWPRIGGSPGYPLDVEIDVDRHQSRRKVAPRIVLAIPVILLSATLGGGGSFPSAGVSGAGAAFSAGMRFAGVATSAAFLAWFASLVLGRMPRGLRDLVAYAIGYTTQVSAYVLLVTERYPTSDPQRIIPDGELPPHPVRIDVRDSLHRSRLVVFFRILLALPHIVWLMLWSVLVLLAAIVAWLVALVIGRVPRHLHRFMAAWVRYAAHVGAFLFLVGGPFPGFVGAAGSYPIDVRIDPPVPQRRLRTLFRLWLAIPAFLLSGALTGALYLVAVLGWWASLVTGRMPEGLRNLGAAAVRYSAQLNAYVLLLTERYPYASPLLRERPRHEQLELPLYAPYELSTGSDAA